MHRFILTFLMIVFAMPAYALRLDNCDTVPHTVTVYYPGKNVEVTLQPGISQNLYGVPIQLRLGKKIIESLRWDDEYCVWKGGELRIQRRGFKRRR